MTHLIKNLVFVTFLSLVLVTAAHAASSPEYMGQLRVDTLRVPMRDGIELSVRVTRPDLDGKYPAVMIYYPYRFYGPTSEDDESGEKLAVPYLAERGYAIVQYDVRGTGNSGGWSKDIYSDAERQDGYDMVEWIADQPWSNENVGMMGISYGGVVQWQVATQRPPHLKAIVVRSANDDMYNEWVYPGGSYRPNMADNYGPSMTVRNFAPPDPDIVGNRWSEIWSQRLENSRPWQVGYITHPTDGPYWQDRTLSKDYSRVKAAALIIGGWSDVYPTSGVRAFENIRSPKHLLVGPWQHIWPENEKTVPGPRIDSRPIVLRWFDYWLKGDDNGVMDEPPVTIFVQTFSPPSAHMHLEEPGNWRVEADWPIPRARNTSLYFDNEGKLSWERPSNSNEESDNLTYHPAAGIASGYHWGGGIAPWGMSIDQRWDEPASISYTTVPLNEDVEVTGRPQAVLFASSTSDIAYFRVKLIDVAPDGTAKLVRYGGLNATHRDSNTNPKPLVPGQIYELKVDVKAMSYVFKKGHKIRVAIANADLPNAWPTPKNASNTLYRGQQTPSQIILPVIPPQNPPLPAPELVLLPNADPEVIENSEPAEWSYKYDYVNKTVTIRKDPMVTTGKRGRMEITSEYTVSIDHPANAYIKTTAELTITRPDTVIVVRADEVTSSNEETFRYIADVTITVNGGEHFNKSWSESVPRELH